MAKCCVHVKKCRVQKYKTKKHDKQMCTEMPCVQDIPPITKCKKIVMVSNGEGEVGAASSVSASPNFFSSDTYPGFAYSIWRSDEKSSAAEVRCEAPVLWEDIQN